MLLRWYRLCFSFSCFSLLLRALSLLPLFHYFRWLRHYIFTFSFMPFHLRRFATSRHYVSFFTPLFFTPLRHAIAAFIDFHYIIDTHCHYDIFTASIFRFSILLAIFIIFIAAISILRHWHYAITPATLMPLIFILFSAIASLRWLAFMPPFRLFAALLSLLFYFDTVYFRHIYWLFSPFFITPLLAIFHFLNIAITAGFHFHAAISRWFFAVGFHIFRFEPWYWLRRAFRHCCWWLPPLALPLFSMVCCCLRPLLVIFSCFLSLFAITLFSFFTRRCHCRHMPPLRFHAPPLLIAFFAFSRHFYDAILLSLLIEFSTLRLLLSCFHFQRYFSVLLRAIIDAFSFITPYCASRHWYCHYFLFIIAYFSFSHYQIDRL